RDEVILIFVDLIHERKKLAMMPDVSRLRDLHQKLGFHREAEKYFLSKRIDADQGLEPHAAAHEKRCAHLSTNPASAAAARALLASVCIWLSCENSRAKIGLMIVFIVSSAFTHSAPAISWALIASNDLSISG